jgi:hypothetical protein
VNATRILNIRLQRCRFFPQLSLTAKKGVEWQVGVTEGREFEGRLDLAIQEILSLNDRDVFWRLRTCEHGPCAKWFYARWKNKRFHSKKCARDAEFAALTPAQKKEMNRKAVKRMRTQRKNAKLRKLKELEVSKSKRGRVENSRRGWHGHL